MDEKKKISVPEILKIILAQDKNLLNSRDDLIAKLEGEVPGALARDLNPINKALQKNVGEIFLAASEADDEKKVEARQKVMAILAQDGMQEKRAKAVVAAFVYALEWDKKESSVESSIIEESASQNETAGTMDEAKEDYDMWTCTCGQKNAGQFCIACGTAQELIGNRPLPEGHAQWVCPCGQINSGKFCIACGKTNMAGKQQDYKSVMTNVEDVREYQPIEPPVKSKYIAPPIPNDAGTPAANNRTKQILISAIVILAAVVLFFIVRGFVDPTNSKASFNPIAKQSTEKKVPAVDSDLSLGGISLGYPLEKVHEILGIEKSQEQKNQDYVNYKYDGMTVVIKGGTVVALVSDGTSVKTKRDMHEGVSLQDVFNAYGKDYEKSEYDNQDLYEYSFTSLNGESGLLRFAVNKSDNKVKYISIRIPDKEDTPQSAGKGQATADASGAKIKFTSYHQAISSRNLRAAYNCLSSTCQSQMGDYGSYASGYQTTLSSTVTNLQVVSANANMVTLSYDLRSRDKSGNKIKVQNFTGTSVMIRENGEWRINEISAKKQGEHFE